MAWTIEYFTSSKKQLSKLDRQTARRIADFLDHRLANLADPRSIGTALGGPMKRYWRYRVGDYRIVCDIQDEKLVVLVIEIDHRSQIYRR